MDTLPPSTTSTAAERSLPRRQTALPFAGIILALLALLLLPLVVGRETRLVREDLLDAQVPFLTAIEGFRTTAADEIAATRTYLATRDPALLEWVERAGVERRQALEQVERTGAAVGGTVPAALQALRERVGALEGVTGARAEPDRLLLADTALVWSRWNDVLVSASGVQLAAERNMEEGRVRILFIQRLGVIVTALLALLALISAVVTVRMERRARAFALESERARMQRQILLDSSGEGVFGLDAEGRCTFLNPAGARLIGYPEEEVLGESLRSLVLPGEVRSDGRGYLRTRGFGGGAIGTIEELALRRKDGSLVEAECLTSPILERGEVRGAVLTVRNIGQRKAIERERLERLSAEQALREQAEAAESRAHFLSEASEIFAKSLDVDTTVDSLSTLLVPGIADSSVIYLIDESGAVQRLQPVHVDPERQRILTEQLEKYPPRIETLIPPVRQALLEGQPSVIQSVRMAELKGVPTDESHHSVIDAVGLQSLVVVPLRARGRIIGAISFGASASGRRYGPEDLALAEDLAGRAALALDNARLYQQSQSAVQARNEVLGIVSHDLRNPLNAVRFGAQALLRHWPPLGDGEIERNQLGAITKAADRMHRLIRDLLDVAQIDAGRLAIEPAPVAARSLLEDAVELVQGIAEERSVRLLLQAPEDLPAIRADGERVLQVLSNLLQNAIKFSPPGSEILLDADAAEDEVVVSVRDHGVGIEAENLTQVFNRFWKRAKGTPGGAGLGLAIARGIVESHGGRIWVESSPGQGSTFYFSIPRERTAGEQEERLLDAGVTTL